MDGWSYEAESHVVADWLPVGHVHDLIERRKWNDRTLRADERSQSNPGSGDSRSCRVGGIRLEGGIQMYANARDDFLR